MPTKEKVYLNNDLMFKYILGTKNHEKYTADLLESFFNQKSGSLKKLKILNSVKFDLKTIKEKRFEMDILVRLENGELINLEMYNKYEINAERKSSLYISKVYSTKSLKRGEKYDLVKPTTQINFVKKDLINDNKRPIKKFLLVDVYNPENEMISDLLKIYVINIDPKEDIEYTNTSKRFKDWIKLLNCENEKQLEEIAKKDKIFGEVVEEMKKFNEDEWIQDYESIDRLKDSQHETEIKEAIKESKKSNSIEIAKTMLEKGYTIKQIKEIIDLPLETIKNLADNSL